MITLTREEAQQILWALDPANYSEPNEFLTWPAIADIIRTRLSAPECVCGEPNTAGVHRQDGPCYQQPEPNYRDVVIKGDLWRIEFLPDHAASVMLVRANYEAQPEPEPVACPKEPENIEELYTAPPQREWQSLTDEEMSEAYNVNYSIYKEHVEYVDFVLIYRAIEAKLKEKNV
jgi:hypothetical protein